MHPHPKDQVLLSKHHHLSKVIISNIRDKNAHIGREHTLCFMRNKFWIRACRDIIRKNFSNCLYPKKVNRRPKIMAHLPEEHLLMYDKPFSSTGVDYCDHL